MGLHLDLCSNDLFRKDCFFLFFFVFLFFLGGGGGGEVGVSSAHFMPMLHWSWAADSSDCRKGSRLHHNPTICTTFASFAGLSWLQFLHTLKQ